jgi:hypothetical protein
MAYRIPADPGLASSPETRNCQSPSCHECPRKAMTQSVTDHSLQRHVSVSLEILRTLILTQSQLFLQSSDGDERSVSAWPRPDFIYTHHFLTNFMKCNRLCYWCTPAARQPMIEPDEIESYRAELDEACRTLPWDRILNAHESFGPILHLLRKTIAPTSAGSVKLEVDGATKQADAHGNKHGRRQETSTIPGGQRTHSPLS